MNILSILSVALFLVYLYVGIKAFKLDKRALINKLFLALCLAMAIWSFSFAYVYSNSDPLGYWMRVSSFGWCTFTAIILNIAMVYTDNGLIKKLVIKIIIYTPAIVLLYMSLFLFGIKIKTPLYVQNIFYISDFLYNFVYLLTAIILIFIWGRKAENIRKRKQSRVIVISSIIPFVLNLLTSQLLPLIGIGEYKNLGHLYTLILIGSIYYAMVRYRLFSLSSNIITDEILEEMMDIVILLNPEGNIMNMNKHAEILSGYDTSEVRGENINNLFQKWDVNECINAADTKCSVFKYKELKFKKRSGGFTPVSITCSVVIDSKFRDILGILITGQDITVTKQLLSEINERKMAEERIMFMANHDSLTGLANRKFFYEVLQEKIDDPGVKKFSVFYIDLDDFKQVNDSYGHEAGDFLLREAGFRINNITAFNDTASRLGGDEFAIISSSVTSREMCENYLISIENELKKLLIYNGIELKVGASIGFGIYPEDGADAEKLVDSADKGMYLMKKINKYTREMKQENNQSI